MSRASTRCLTTAVVRLPAAVRSKLVGGWLWDGIAIQVGVWYYDPATIAGVWLLGMPLEEWLWIVGVTLMFGSVTVVWMERGKV